MGEVGRMWVVGRVIRGECFGWGVGVVGRGG